MNPINTSNNNPIILWFLNDFISTFFSFNAEKELDPWGMFPLAKKVKP